MSATTASQRARKAYLNRDKVGPCTRDPNNRLRCAGCGFVPQNKDPSRWEESITGHLERSRKRETGEIPKLAPKLCPYCRRELGAVRRHIEICHQKVNSKYRCTTCGTSGFELEYDFNEHINEHCSVQKDKTELFDGWIWTKTDPSIPVREDAKHPEFVKVLKAASEALDRILSTGTTATVEQIHSDIHSFPPTVQSHQPLPPPLASQQPLPTNFDQVFANLPSLNPQIATQRPVQVISYPTEPGHDVWSSTAYPAPATNFTPLPTQMNLQQPFLPHNSFNPPALPSQYPQAIHHPSEYHYDPYSNQFHSHYDLNSTGHSLAKRLSPRQLRRYGSHIFP